VQWNSGIQMAMPFFSTLDLSYTGQRSYNTQETLNLNTIDYGTAYLPSMQDPTLAPGGVNNTLVNTNPNSVRYYTGYSNVTQNQPWGRRTYHSIQVSWNRRLSNGIGFGFNDTISLYDQQEIAPRLQHNADGTITVREDQAKAQEMFGDNVPQTHIMRANFIWQLPRLVDQTGGMRYVSWIVNDWNLAGIWNGQTGPSYSLGYSYTSNGNNLAITGSPDFGGRVLLVGDTGSGCSSDPLRQFNTASVNGPLAGSVGLESASNYMKGCFVSSMDLSISRVIPVGTGKNITLRVDLFNAFNQAAITGRNTTAQFASPATNTAITNLPFDANGDPIESRIRPSGAGFGVANAYQPPRAVQLQVRFAF
jgi:hypothetical protein